MRKPFWTKEELEALREAEKKDEIWYRRFFGCLPGCLAGCLPIGLSCLLPLLLFLR